MVGTDNEGWDFWTAFGAPGFGKITGAHPVRGVSQVFALACLREDKFQTWVQGNHINDEHAQSSPRCCSPENGRVGARQRCGGGEKGRDGEIESYARVCSGLRILKKYVI